MVLNFKTKNILKDIDLLNVLWATSQRTGPIQHASTVCNKISK